MIYNDVETNFLYHGVLFWGVGDRIVLFGDIAVVISTLFVRCSVQRFKGIFSLAPIVPLEV